MDFDYANLKLIPPSVFQNYTGRSLYIVSINSRHTWERTFFNVFVMEKEQNHVSFNFILFSCVCRLYGHHYLTVHEIKSVLDKM